MTGALFGNWLVGTCIALAVTCDLLTGTDYLRRIRESDRTMKRGVK
jgi:hypothetical protein